MNPAWNARSEKETLIFYYPPSKVLLMLVNGSLESLISRTTFVRLSNAGNIRVNFIMWPGNHDGGFGRAGSCASIVEIFSDGQKLPPGMNIEVRSQCINTKTTTTTAIHQATSCFSARRRLSDRNRNPSPKGMREMKRVL